MASLFRKFAVLRQHKGNPFAPIQILTGDTRKGCHTRRGRLLDERRSFQRKSRIERRFESLPGVQRFANLWGTFGSFRTSEKNKIVPFREVRGFPNLDSAHPNNNFPLTKLNPLPLRGSVPAGTARSACFFRRPWWHFSAAPPLFSYFLYSTKSRAKKLFRLTAVSLPGRHTPCAF